MASEQKAFASLSSGLLARKGAARPAMRPQGFGQVGGGLDDLGWNDMGFDPPKPAAVGRDGDHDAFGDSVAEHPIRNGHAGLTPVQSPVHSQQAEIVDRFVSDGEEGEFDETAAPFEPEPEPELVEPTPGPEPVANAVVQMPARAPVPRRVPKSRATPGSKGKAAFTLRLDPERHLKLRLASAVSGRSAQQIVTDAVDRLLTEIPELDAMAARAKRKE